MKMCHDPFVSLEKYNMHKSAKQRQYSNKRQYSADIRKEVQQNLIKS